ESTLSGVRAALAQPREAEAYPSLFLRLPHQIEVLKRGHDILTLLHKDSRHDQRAAGRKSAGQRGRAAAQHVTSEICEHDIGRTELKAPRYLERRRIAASGRQIGQSKAYVVDTGIEREILARALNRVRSVVDAK